MLITFYNFKINNKEGVLLVGPLNVIINTSDLFEHLIGGYLHNEIAILENTHQTFKLDRITEEL